MLKETIKAIYINPRQGYYTTSLQLMTRVSGVIWTRRQVMFMSSVVEAFFFYSSTLVYSGDHKKNSKKCVIFKKKFLLVPHDGTSLP